MPVRFMFRLVEAFGESTNYEALYLAIFARNQITYFAVAFFLSPRRTGGELLLLWRYRNACQWSRYTSLWLVLVCRACLVRRHVVLCMDIGVSEEPAACVLVVKYASSVYQKRACLLGRELAACGCDGD